MKNYQVLKLAALLVLCCVMFGCGKEDNPSDGGNGCGSIYGCVTDFATGEPVKNANVQLRPRGETTLTGYDGLYEFLDIQDGDYSITVSKAEYTDLIDDYVIEVKNGRRMRRDVQIEKLPLALRVVDSNGDDISNLDFGSEPDVTNRTFSIFNDSPQTLTWWIEENCNWIVDVKSMISNSQSGRLEAGRQEPIKVIIDRTLVGTGLKTYILNINSDNGSKELIITAGEEVGLPSLTTQQVSNVTSNSVTFNGTIVNAGLPPYTERGFVYATSPQPTLNNGNKITSAVNNQSTFSATVSGLNSDLTYYVRAYAKNTLGAAYGNDVVFSMDGVPTAISTSAATNIGNNSARLNGIITVAGVPAYTEKGFCYGKTNNPTVSNNKVEVYGLGTGDYYYNLSGLEYRTTYYVRAYAIQKGVLVYGTTIDFTTSWSGVQVNTSAVTEIESTSATFNGMISNAGSPSYTEKGFCYSDWSSTPTINHNKVDVSGSGIGNYSKKVTGLSGGQTYHVRAYAIQNGEIVYGDAVSFTTVSLPIVYTDDITDLTVSEWPYFWSVTFNGTVASSGSPAYIERGFCYSNYGEPTYLNNKIVVSGTGIGPFSKNVTDLWNEELYNVRAYVKTASGEYIYGQNVSFYTYSWKRKENE